MPAQLLSDTIAVLADTGAQTPDLGNEPLPIEVVKVVVKILLDHPSILQPQNAPPQAEHERGRTRVSSPDPINARQFLLIAITCPSAAIRSV